MQNHGGYETTDDPNFETRIQLTGEYAGQYPQVDQYLSLIRYSDDAVRELIEYFSQADEPDGHRLFRRPPAERDERVL